MSPRTRFALFNLAVLSAGLERPEGELISTFLADGAPVQPGSDLLIRECFSVEFTVCEGAGDCSLLVSIDSSPALATEVVATVASFDFCLSCVAEHACLILLMKDD